ncbi:MAG: ribonuclease P protein component [Sphingomonadaceae bacterium]
MQRRHRLKKSAEFQRVRALRQSWAHPLLVLYVAPNGLELTRIGISTSKRIGKAVTRNRVKRLIREATRSYLPSLPPGRDLVFVARPASAEAGFDQINRAVEILLRRARLLPAQERACEGLEQTKHEVDRTVSD